MSTEPAASADPESAIAIVGLAVRFPDASTIDQFWQNLCDGRESVRTLTPHELRQAGVPPEIAARDDHVAAAATIDDIDMFDAAFFGFSPSEARITDPQHRIFMECAWEALEDAGHVPDRFQGRIGVYAGSGLNTYLLHNLLPAGRELTDTMGMLPLVIGNKGDFMVTQTSYALGLTGPSVSVNTACSTSLVATHFGVQALLNYECDAALVGGVTIQVPQTGGYLHQPGGVFSPDGRCRPFDAAGGGTIPGNGAGVVVLKRLEDAIADGDQIYALIRATAINNDGKRKVGFTAPSVQGQRELIASAMALGDLPAGTISYVEAHGTATALGDPLEIRALADAYRGEVLADGKCAIGSVKANLGHLDAAAGIASLIKTALCLKHGTLVPSINYAAPNAACDFSATPFHVNTTLRNWDVEDLAMPRRAGVSSFGIGGTNAHAILEQWSAVEDFEPNGERGWTVLPLSARSEGALDGAVGKLHDHLQRHPEQSASAVGYTLQTGRTAFAHRRAFLCGPAATPAEALSGPAATHSVAGVAESVPRQTVFMFPGVGDQYAGMARDLYRREPVFADTIDRCAEKWREHGSIDLCRLFDADPRVDASSPVPDTTPAADPFAALRAKSPSTPETGAPDLTRADTAHAAIFAVEYAMAKLLMSWGITPAALIGHSLGEYAAACIAGVLSLDDAVKVVARRAELVEQLPEGAMLAAAAPATVLQNRLPNGVAIAAINTAASCVVSGPPAALETLRADLSAEGIAALRVKSAHAFHSTMMDQIRPQLADLMAGVELRGPSLPIISNLTGGWMTEAEATSPDYWVEHACRCVRFADGLATLRARERYAYLEVGPGRGLSAFLLQERASDERNMLCAAQCLAGEQDVVTDSYLIARSLAACWCDGVEIDWRAVQGGVARRHVSLPTYAFDRQRHWIDPPVGHDAFAGSALADTPHKRPADADPAPIATSFPAAPEGEVEQLMGELWMRVLGTAAVGREDNFFHLGGSSLLALQLISHIRDAVQVELPLKVVFDNPSLKRMSAHLEHMLLSELEEGAGGEPPHAEAVAEQHGEYAVPMVLPNGLQIVQFNQAETEHFYHDIFETEVYARHGIQLRQDAVVFDVGANVGLFSLFVRQQADDATIYAFEPAPPLFAALTRNTQAHASKMRLFNLGISAAQGRRELTFYPYSTGMSTFHADIAEERQVLRAIVSNQHDASDSDLMVNLDALLSSRFSASTYDCEISTISDIIDGEGVERIDLLKIDVQKSELEVLEGIKSWHWPIIKQIVIEVHDVDGRVEIVRYMLAKKGFAVTVEQDELYRGTCIHNLYALRERREDALCDRRSDVSETLSVAGASQ